MGKNKMSPRYPRDIYIVLVYGDNKGVCGAYVGASNDVYLRMEYHRRYAEFRKLMMKNGYKAYCVDTMQNESEAHLEYDWINYFKEIVCPKHKIKLFNKRMGWCHFPDWERIQRVNIEEVIA